MISDAAVQGVSGAIGGIVATIATYPLMTVTTRQATRVKEEPVAAADEASDLYRKRPARQSTLAELLEIVRTSGVGGLFGGLGTALFGTTVSQGVYFYLYSLLRALAVERRQLAEAARVAAGGAAGRTAAASQDITVAESLLVAALAGAGNVLLTNPVWLVATRMQARRRGKAAAPAAASTAVAAGEGGGEVEDIDLPPPTFLAVCRSVYQEYGLQGFWNGVGAALVMVINPTIQYAFYEWLVKMRGAMRRRQYREQHGKAAPAAFRASALDVFMLSALAKAGATVLTYPLLTIKTRMYTAKRGDKDMQYASVAHAAVQILRKEGLGGYYKGLNSKIVQSVLAAALLFVCKEKITDFTRVALLVAATRRKHALA